MNIGGDATHNYLTHIFLQYFKTVALSCAFRNGEASAQYPPSSASCTSMCSFTVHFVASHLPMADSVHTDNKDSTRDRGKCNSGEAERRSSLVA